jgi:predicted DCC family thiol-disulfide oxidoreductase YuxK
MPDETAKNPELTVYYDGACPLCTAEIGHYETRDGADAICFVNIAEENARTGDDLDCEAALKRFHVRKPDGTLLSGAAAFAEIWETLPGWRWLARLAKLPGVLWILEIGYRLFLPIRPILSRIASRFGATPRTPPSLDNTPNPS